MSSQIDLTQIWMLSPELSVVLLGLLVVVLDLITQNRRLVTAVAIAGLAVPTFLTLSLAGQWFGALPHDSSAFFGMLVVDPFAIFFKFLFLFIGFGVMLVSVGYVNRFLRV